MSRKKKVPASLTPAQASVPAVNRDAQLASIKEHMRVAAGVRSADVGALLAQHVVAMQSLNKFHDAGEEILVGTAWLQELQPLNGVEAMLAVQMISTYNAGLLFLSRAISEDLLPEVIDANVNRATRFMRLFKDQAEALAKLKGKAGQQHVTVEHVHVHKGGQAIVGAVTSTKPSGGPGGS